MKSNLLKNIAALMSLTLSLWSFTSHAQGGEDRLRDLSHQYSCYSNTKRAQDLYKLIVLYKFDDETYYLRINKLINISSEINQKYINRVLEFASLAANNSSSSIKFENQLKEIAKNENKIETMLHDIEIWEASNLVTFVSVHEYVLEQVEIMKSLKDKLIKLQCISESETLIQPIANLEKWVVTLSKARLFIVESRRKRQMLLTNVRNHVYQKLAADQLTQIANDSKDSIDKMKALVNFTRISESFFDTWLQKTRYGIARGLDTQYLLFYEPIHILQELASFLDSNAKTVANIRGIDETARQDLLGRIKIYRKSVSDRLSSLLNVGWQGQFEKQKLLTRERIKKIDRFTVECRAALTRFMEQESSIKTAEDFQTNQDLYGDTVLLCNAKK